MARRSIAGSQFIPTDILDVPDIRITADAKFSINAKLKLTGYKPNDFNRDLNRAVKRANQLISDRLRIALDEAMMSTAWGGNDIIDTGRLKNSLTITSSSGGIGLSYNVPYAALVHYGGYITPYGNEALQKIYLPGRPWVDSVLRGGGPVAKFDFESVYREAINSVFG